MVLKSALFGITLGEYTPSVKVFKHKAQWIEILASFMLSCFSWNAHYNLFIAIKSKLRKGFLTLTQNSVLWINRIEF